jgi:hypothetical protein
LIEIDTFRVILLEYKFMKRAWLTGAVPFLCLAAFFSSSLGGFLVLRICVKDGIHPIRRKWQAHPMVSAFFNLEKREVVLWLQG